jgi:hypothetical protein
LSLKSGVDLAYRYNQAFVATFSQFQKYGQSVKNYKDQVDSIRKTYKFTYEESIRLASGFEKSFNILGPEKMNNVLKSIANTVGADNQAMDSFLQSITSITAQNPLLEEMLENVEGNAEAIEKYSSGLLASGKIGISQYKQMLELTGASGRKPSDASVIDDMQKQNLGFRQVQNIYEDGVLKVGQDVLSVSKMTLEINEKWASVLSTVLQRYTEISALAGGIGGGVSGALGILEAAANLKMLGAGRALGSIGSAGRAVGGVSAGLGLGGSALAIGGTAAAGFGAGYAISRNTSLGNDDATTNWYGGVRSEYKKNGSSYSQYGPSVDAQKKKLEFQQKQKEKIQEQVAQEIKIQTSLDKQNQSRLQLAQAGELLKNSLERQKTLLESSSNLLQSQVGVFGRTGQGSSASQYQSFSTQLLQQEKTLRERITNLEAQGGMDDPEKLAEVQRIQTQLLEINKQRTEAAKMFIKENEPQIEQEKSRISLAEQSIALADSAGLGLRAQVGQRKELINLINTQLALNEKQLQRALQEKAEAERRGDTYKVFEIESEILKIRQEQVSAVQKQAEASKSMREGWIGAISAMTQGAGVFSRILITQDKALGNLQFASPDRIATLMGGGVSGGRTQSARWTPGGFVEGAAGSYENGVLGQYGIPSGSGIQGIAAAMIAWQASVGSKMNPSAAAFGVGPQGTAEVTTAVSEGFKKAISEQSSKGVSAVQIMTPEVQKSIQDSLTSAFDNISKTIQSEVIKKINSGR